MHDPLAWYVAHNPESSLARYERQRRRLCWTIAFALLLASGAAAALYWLNR